MKRKRLVRCVEVRRGGLLFLGGARITRTERGVVYVKGKLALRNFTVLA